MKLLSSLLTIALLTLGVPLLAYPPDCGNNATHLPSHCATGNCPTNGDLFNPYTGDEHREVRDLEVGGSVGEIPLVWMRYANSRFGSYYKYIYGDGSNWNSSFCYNMSDAGLDEKARPQLFISYPEGGGVYFSQNLSNPSVWLPLSAITERLFQDGNNFYLQLPNGHRYHFQKFILSTGNHYQLQDIRDNYQNIYRLSYDRYGFLSKVTEPAGRYLEITYQVVASSYYLVGKVTTSDGRSVKYNYDVFNDGVASWVLLNGADYGDGTKAVYTYSQTEPGSRPSLEHAIDPRYNGTDVNMRFTYDPANAWGFVKEEINGVTGKVMVTLSTDIGKRTACYANGRVQLYSMPAELLGLIKDYTDGLARKTRYTYYEGAADQGGPGLMKTETDALGRTTIYVRTVYGNPLEITYPDGSKEKWTRDDLDQILTHTDELGRVTTYTRDARQRTTRIDYPDGTKEKFAYNSFGEVVAHTRRNGAVETSVYNNRGLKASFVDAEGNITQYVYDVADRLASVTDARGNTTSSQYNERGLLTGSIHADGSFQSYGYDDFGNQTSEKNELGNTWKTHYDEFKRRDSTTDPLGRLTVYQYDLPNGICGCSHDNGKPTGIVLPSGRITKIEYDVEWQKISETAGAGTVDAATTYYEYDMVGNLVTIVDPRKKNWLMEFDARDRRTSFTDPLGHTVKWTYDNRGNIVSIIRPDDGMITHQYDAMNRLVETMYPHGGTIRIKYDEDGNMIKLTDPNNHTYNYEFDLLDRKKRVVYPGDTFERFIYDQVGNLATYTNRSGNLRTYTYDNRNRETNSIWSDNTPAVHKTYDEASRLISMSSTVSTLSYEYDIANEMLSETQSGSGLEGASTVKYLYNADGIVSSLIYPDGRALYYNYSGRNQVSSLFEKGMAVVSYSYDLNGNRIKKDLCNGTSVVYNYDDANRTWLVDNAKNGVSFGRFEYGYDNMNRRKYVKRDNDKGDVFSYDAIDQITGVQYNVSHPDNIPVNPVRVVEYEWDYTGNRKNVKENGLVTDYVTNNRNEYTRVGESRLTYNANGDAKTFDGWSYTYDAQDRLISAKKGNKALDFYYDARNRCVKRTSNGVTTFFYYDKWNLIGEHSSMGSNKVYIHGAQVDEIIKQVTDNPSTSVYYHYDALGNVTHLTGAAGNVIEKYVYDVFGAPTIEHANGDTLKTSTVGNRFLFTGREYIQELNLYDYRNRIYSPVVGRFLQPDPIRFRADYNLYRYVNNDPPNLVDPLGLECCTSTQRTACAFPGFLGAVSGGFFGSFLGPWGTAGGAVAGGVGLYELCCSGLPPCSCPPTRSSPPPSQPPPQA